MFVPGKNFQPYLMFVGEAMSLPESGEPEIIFTVTTYLHKYLPTQVPKYKGTPPVATYLQ